MTYQKAINEALSEAMEADPKVLIYGLDVADHKRCFGTHAGLVEKFPGRCIDTPLSEDAMTGVGCGMVISGLRPVNVHIRADFLPLCMNQLANMVSTQDFMSNGRLKCPLTIRVIVGRGWGQGYQHAKSLISSYAHIPGLQVFMPVTPADAKCLLTSAIFGDVPTIVLEHRWLYWQEGEVYDCFGDTDLKAHTMRSGSDITIVASSWMCIEACYAADILKDRVSVQVINIRSLVPLDMNTICHEVNRTGVCLVVDNDTLSFGASAEIAAQVSNRCFHKLEIPVERLAWPDEHIPTARHLETEFYPNAHDVVRKVEKMLSLKPTDLSEHPLITYQTLSNWKGPF